MWTDESSQSRQLHTRARRVMPGGSTRAAVWMDPYPPYVVRGEGARVYDVDGRAYLDLANNLGVLIHGHAQPSVVAAVQAQAALGSCFAMPTPTEVELAELLCARVPGFERIRFINTGSEAVALAIKTARAFTGRHKIVKLEGVYHGSYDFAEISNYSTPENWGNTPRSVATVPATPPGVLDSVLVIPANDSAQAREVLLANADDIAAVLVDPVPPRCGMQPLVDEFVTSLRALTRELGMLLIYDEVIAFRFGYAGSQGRFGGEPDLTALGKIIGGGYPVGAVAGRADIMEATASQVSSSGTFTANPITMVAGLASMQLLQQESFSALDALGERMRAGCNQIIADKGAAMQVLGTGSISSIYFHQRPVTDYRSYYKRPTEATLTAAFHRAMVERGVILAPTATCFASTVLTAADEAEFLEAFAHSIDAVME